MKSEKIASIFINYLEKESTDYALLLSGKWGSGKTYLWNNTLSNRIVEKGFKPVYISLNGISSVNEVEVILLNNLLPDSLNNKFVKGSIGVLRNGLNALGTAFAGGLKVEDLTSGVDLNLDYSKLVICFDDLERSSIPTSEVLGLINDYVEHKNLKILICAYEEEISNQKDYNRIKEKVVGRVLNYTSDFNELFQDYINSVSDNDFKSFLDDNKGRIIHFFKKHNIQNLRTFKFFIENISQLYSFYKDEGENEVNRMLFFTAVISNEFKKGNLSVTNLEDKRGIDEFMIYLNIQDVFPDDSDNFIKKREKKEQEEKKYSELFAEEYLSLQQEKEMYLFSNSIYEFILSGYLDVNKIESEINSRKEPSFFSEEEQVFRDLTIGDYRVLENEEFEDSLKKFLDYSEKGKYDMYLYPTIYENLKHHIKNESLQISETDLTTNLLEGLKISETTSDINESKVSYIKQFKDESERSIIEKTVLEYHNEKESMKIRDKANKIYQIIDEEFADEFEIKFYDFIDEVLQSSNGLFHFLNPDEFFEKLISLNNHKMSIFISGLKDFYNKTQFIFPEKESLFFEKIESLLHSYCNTNDIKNPRKILLQDLLKLMNYFTKKK